MTALLYLLDKNRVSLAMDSLTTDGETKEPLKFASKIFLLPHLKGAVCGTGCLDLILEWYSYIQKDVLATDIIFLDKIATEKLCEISKEISLSGGQTTTIYHFGYNEKAEVFTGFAYRGTNDFKSEKLIYSIGIKPSEGEIQEYALKELAQNGLPEGFIKTMQQQKIYDDNLSKDKQVGIGGEIHFLSMDKNESLFSVCHRFDDYNEALQKMFRHPTMSIQ